MNIYTCIKGQLFEYSMVLGSSNSQSSRSVYWSFELSCNCKYEHTFVRKEKK